jgi:hypothetical protein
MRGAKVQSPSRSLSFPRLRKPIVCASSAVSSAALTPLFFPCVSLTSAGLCYALKAGLCLDTARLPTLTLPETLVSSRCHWTWTASNPWPQHSPTTASVWRLPRLPPAQLWVFCVLAKPSCNRPLPQTVTRTRLRLYLNKAWSESVQVPSWLIWHEQAQWHPGTIIGLCTSCYSVGHLSIYDCSSRLAGNTRTLDFSSSIKRLRKLSTFGWRQKNGITHSCLLWAGSPRAHFKSFQLGHTYTISSAQLWPLVPRARPNWGWVYGHWSSGVATGEAVKLQAGQISWKSKAIADIWTVWS